LPPSETAGVDLSVAVFILFRLNTYQPICNKAKVHYIKSVVVTVSNIVVVVACLLTAIAIVVIAPVCHFILVVGVA